MRNSIKRTLFIAIYVVFIFFLLEICARSYYAVNRHISFFSSANEIIYGWYPEFKNIKHYEYEPDRLNILLLGGSVLIKDWGSVQQRLEEQTKAILGKQANILNLAASAHGSLDSFYKYQWLSGKRFDVILFYHAINETRANNIPASLFKKDYSHYAWYEEINFYFNHPYLRKMPFTLPYFVKHLIVQLKREVLYRKQYAPEHSPRKEWVQYGNDIKTRDSFRENISKIIDIAASRHERLIIPTFAYYKTSGNENGSSAPDMKFTEIWGNYENVKSGINVHNSVIRDLAKNHNFIFIDMEKLMDNEKKYFKDICHFTDEGSQFYARAIIEKLK